MTDIKARFWSVNYWINTVLTTAEFWTFIVLREQHVIMWSWWWLFALQAGNFISALNSYSKIKRLVS